MQLIIDLDLQQVVMTFGSKQPVPYVQCKSQDTPELDIYFWEDGANIDMGPSPGIRFGVFDPTLANPNPLVASQTFTRRVDANNLICYTGYPNFNTTQLAAMIGAAKSYSAIGEVRFQTGPEIERSLDIPYTILHSFLAETILDTTQAAFTVPAVASNVTIQVTNTGWLKPGLNLFIGAGAGNYQVVSITDATHFVAQNQGSSSTVTNASPGTVIPLGTTLGIAATSTLPTYPDPSIIELTTHKGQPSGYAQLDASTLLLASEIPVDGQTISILASNKIGSSSILATITANFTTPAANAPVTVAVNSSTALVTGSYIRIPIAGYYIVTAKPDSTHVTIQNNGDPFNAASGVTINSGAVLLPAQAAAGSAGQGAYTTTTAVFTVPAIGSSVTVTLGSTAWMSGSGYILFIAGAGYYSVTSIIDGAHASLNNLGYAATNAAPGTNIASGAAVSPGGVSGVAGVGSPGANAYDATTVSFTMPSAGTGVNVTISNTGWLAVGQELYIAGAGYFSVGSIASPTVFNAINSNYPGATAPGSNVAAGAKVTASGVIGPAGAGGAGLNAFTTLSASFTQPAINGAVTVSVGTSAWMAPGQTVFVSAGGFYTVQTLPDVSHATLVNLGYPGNTAQGTLIALGGIVSPGGLIGLSGASPYTTTSASFTMPAIGNSVSVSVVTTAFMVGGLNIYIQGAGYFTVASVTDSTHVVLTNSGATGNVSSGNVISTGAGVVSAGAAGPQGLAGGAGASLSDAETAVGTSWINNPTGILKRIIPGTNITVTDGGDRVTVAASGGGGGPGAGYWDPTNGLFFSDDLSYGTGLSGIAGYQVTNGSGGTCVGTSLYGQTSALKVLGCQELATGTAGSNTGTSFNWGGATGLAGGPIVYGCSAALVFKSRVFLESALPATGGGYAFRIGIGQLLSAAYFTPAVQGFYFEYSPDNNSGNWRVGVGGASITYTNTSVATAFDTAYDLEIDANSAWTTLTFLINGVTAATISTGIPTTAGMPFWQYAKGSAGTVNQKAAVDSWMIYYPVAR